MTELALLPTRPPVRDFRDVLTGVLMGMSMKKNLPAPVQEVPLVPTHHISCIIPAYNEEETIAGVLQSLLNQTRPPDTIHVIVNNTNDETVWKASEFEGEHISRRRLGLMRSEVVIHDIGKNPAKKVGALNYGFDLARAEGAEFILGVDGDTTLDPKCVEHLLEESAGDTRIGGLSAIYTFQPVKSKSPVAQFLLAAQKAQFAGFNMDNLVKDRHMAVLGGQCSLFRLSALEAVCAAYRQSHPWVTDSEVEDSLLSLQIKKVGFLTKISAHARSYVGPMLSLRSLYAQQVKWTAGSIELLKTNPFHPNMRLRWKENISMLFNIATRLLFVLLLAASLSIGAFEFSPIWLVPPLVAWLLILRVTASMHHRTAGDWLYALLFFPAEFYMWLRSTYFIASWWQVMNKVERDNWGAQAAAESGKGKAGLLWPILVLGSVGGVSYYSWTSMSDVAQAGVIAYGWPLLMVITVCLTLGMLKKALRRHRGFTV